MKSHHWFTTGKNKGVLTVKTEEVKPPQMVTWATVLFFQIYSSCDPAVIRQPPEQSMFFTPACGFAAAVSSVYFFCVWVLLCLV